MAKGRRGTETDKSDLIDGGQRPLVTQGHGTPGSSESEIGSIEIARDTSFFRLKTRARKALGLDPLGLDRRRGMGQDRPHTSPVVTPGQEE